MHTCIYLCIYISTSLFFLSMYICTYSHLHICTPSIYLHFLQLFHHKPTTKWINPSDCVDMDCDARRKILITDIDGGLFGAKQSSVISKSEFHWDDDDRSWGLGMLVRKHFLFCIYRFYIIILIEFVS